MSYETTPALEEAAFDLAAIEVAFSVVERRKNRASRTSVEQIAALRADAERERKKSSDRLERLLNAMDETDRIKAAHSVVQARLDTTEQALAATRKSNQALMQALKDNRAGNLAELRLAGIV